MLAEGSGLEFTISAGTKVGRNADQSRHGPIPLATPSHQA